MMWKAHPPVLCSYTRGSVVTVADTEAKARERMQAAMRVSLGTPETGYGAPEEVSEDGRSWELGELEVVEGSTFLHWGGD